MIHYPNTRAVDVAAYHDNIQAALAALFPEMKTLGCYERIEGLPATPALIFGLTERITVFKNGQLVDTVNTSAIDQGGLVRLMTDNWVSRESDRSHSSSGREVFRVEHLSTSDGIVKDVSFTAHSGEIMGLFGLGGSGRTESLEALYGLREKSGGKIVYNGSPFDKPSPAKCIKNGIVLVHEDRRGHSLVVSRSLKDNIVLSSIDGYVKHGLYDVKGERADAEEKIQQMSIQCQGMNQSVGELSGGNQQKAVFARALMTKPELFLCDEPTQAVDVKTRQEIHDLLRKCASEGSAVVYVTSDLKEMLEVADSITVISNGKTWERLENRNLTSEQVLGYCYRDR